MRLPNPSSTVVGIMVSIAAIIGLLTMASPGYAVAPSVTPAVGAVSEAPDYSSEQWADRWDYANADDFSLTPKVQSHLLNNLSMSNPGGSLSFDTSPQGYLEPIWSSGVLAHGRDAGIHPLDADKYTHLSIRMWSSGFDNSGQIWWASCLANGPQCWGAMALTIQPGWNTYDLAIAPGYAPWPLPWSGQIRDLRIIPSTFSSIHVEIDWMRLYQPASNVNLTVQSGGDQSEVWWVDANDPAYATPPATETKTADRLGYLNNGGNITFPASTFPPGTYRFFTKQAGQVSAYSDPVVVEAQPEPVVLDPDIAGGDDFATVVRGDPWDFSQPTDAWRLINAQPGWGGWYLQGSYLGPNPNDPQLTLPLAGPIDASLYHRLTFRVGYDGPFGLENSPGGGMVSRFVWDVDQGPGIFPWHDSQDIIIFPGWQTVSIDLKTNPPSLAEDESSGNPIGWGAAASRWVSGLRFDPHEDPGGRTWYLDDIRLARNDRGTPNFNIRFQDNAWEAGTTAEIWADSNASGYDGVRIANGINVDQGVNTFNWNGAGVSAGTWWIYLVLHDADGTTVKAYSSGPVDISPPPDITPPTVLYNGPSGSVALGDPTIDASFSDQAPSSGINAGSAKLVLNGSMENPCSVVGAAISCPTSGLDNGHYDAVVRVSDNAGNTGSVTGSFDVTGQSYLIYDSYFTWYDDIGGVNWVLMANPSTSVNYVTFNLDIAGDAKRISPPPGFAPGQVSPGSAISPIYPGTRGGPVHIGYKANASSADKALVSQRVLWDGNSLEEVLGTDAGRLSNHFYWTWYDDASPGYTNFVMIANPGSSTVYYRITIAGSDQGPGSWGSVDAGKSAFWRDSAKRGGPVEVEAWSDGVDGSLPADVLASQRVLSNYDHAFNEVIGVPGNERSDHYIWTWYDSIGSHGSNWILVANPSDGPSELYYRIKVGATEEVSCAGPVAPNGYALWSRPDLRDGPAELMTYSDSSCNTPAVSVASQRVIWGPSFEEVPGYPFTSLAPDYYWTWYDMLSPGAQNWVMITNLNPDPVTYTIQIGDVMAPGGTGSIDPGKSVYRTFNQNMGGPVQVTASGNVLASQRVLWQGYFNETLGTVLN